MPRLRYIKKDYQDEMIKMIVADIGENTCRKFKIIDYILFFLLTSTLTLLTILIGAMFV
jgi:hypothetical protein